ncbi:MAG: hypothetical protein ABIT37_11980 [Luteolibacter sp.]
MKSLLLFPIVALALSASSCRTVTPIDPMTMKQSCKCLPENMRPDGSCCNHHVSGSK